MDREITLQRLFKLLKTLLHNAAVFFIFIMAEKVSLPHDISELCKNVWHDRRRIYKQGT
jgi:hypothetical protein